MKKLIENLRIKHQLIAMGCVIVVVILLLIAQFITYAKNLSQQYNVLSSLQILQTTFVGMAEHQSKFISIEHTNEEFIATGNSYYEQAYDEHTQKCYAILDSLQSTKSFNYSETNRIEQVKSRLRNANFEFSGLCKLVQTRGSNNVGVFGAAAKSFERFAENVKNNTAFDYLLPDVEVLRLQRNNYYLKPSEKTRNEQNKALTSLETKIRALMIGNDSLDNTSPAAIIRNSFYLHKDNLNRLYETDLEIGYLPNDKSIINKQNTLTDYINTQMQDLTVDLTAKHTQQSKSVQAYIYALVAVLLLLLYFVYNRLTSRLLVPLKTIAANLRILSVGDLPAHLPILANNEITEINTSLNALTYNLQQTREFSLQVGAGNFDADINVFDNKGQLGVSLYEMKAELARLARERNEQAEAEKKRNWSNNGISMFNDILRQSANSIDTLAYNVISNLVNYLEASQGAFFARNNSNNLDVHYAIAASYAYNRKKYLSKKIYPGEDLVGTCIQERKTIALDEVPENYAEIRSGLGKATPNRLLIVPLKHEEEILGAIEIASFREINDFQLSFVEKIAEAVAATLAGLNMNLRTAQLLEMSQSQAEELALKEEMMRRNVEELRMTQEMSAKKEAEASGFVSAVNHTIIRADYNIDGKLDYANSKFLELMGYSLSEMKGNYVSTIIDPKEKDTFETEWIRVVKGGKHIEREMRFNTRNGYRWLLATYTSIKNVQTRVVKILFLAIDIHIQKSRNLDFQGELRAITSTVIKAEFATDGTLRSCNSSFKRILRIEDFEIGTKNILNLIMPGSRTEFKNSWALVAVGESVELAQQFLSSTDDAKWFRGAFTPVKDFDGNVYKIIYVAYDISTQKRVEQEANERAETLVKKETELRKNMTEMLEMQNQLAHKDEELTAKVKELNQRNKEQLEALMRKDVEMRGQLDAINKTNLLVEYDIDGNMLSANDIFCSIFNYQASDLVGKNHRIFFNTQYSRSADYRDFWTNLRNGNPMEGEYVRLSKDGEEIYTNGVYHPIRDNDGKITKILELSFDVSESRRRQYEIAGQMEAINRTNAMCEYNPDGTIIEANSMFCTLHGYTREELIGQEYKLLTEADFAESDNYQRFWSKLKKGNINEDVFKRRSRNGAEIYLKGVFLPIVNKDGKIKKILELSFDISANKKLELDLLHQTAQLKDQEELTMLNMEEMKATQEEMQNKEAERQGLLNSIKEATFAFELDLEGYILDISEVAAKIIDRPIDAIIDTNHRDFVVYKDITEEQYAEMWRTILSGVPVKRTTHKSIHGTDYWFSDTFNPIYDQNDQIVKILNISFDITPLKQLEAELVQRNDEISKSQEQLQTSLRQMEEAKEEIALRENETRSIVRSINRSAIVFELDMEGYIIRSNQMAQELFGVWRQDLIGKRYSELNADADMVQLIKDLQFGRTLQHEGKFVCNEKEVWLFETFSTIFDKDKKPSRIMDIAFDITPRKRQEQELKRQTEELQSQEEELRQNLEEMQAIQDETYRREAEIQNQIQAVDRINIKAVFTLDGEFIEVNEPFVELFGYEQHQLRNLNHRVLMTVKERRAADWTERWGRLRAGANFEDEFQRLNKDGDVVYLKGTYSTMYDDMHTPYAILLMASDITIQKEQDLKIQAQINAINRTVLFVLMQADGTIVEANALFLNRCGYMFESIKNRSFGSLLSGKSYAGQEILFWDTLTKGLPVSGEFEIAAKDGSTVFVNGTFAPQKDLNGQVEKIMLLATDISSMA